MPSLSDVEFISEAVTTCSSEISSSTSPRTNSQNVIQKSQQSKSAQISKSTAILDTIWINDNESSCTKDWRNSIILNLRNHLVYKLVQGIFPTCNSSALLDKRMQYLVAYAKMFECDTYKIAISKSEYYHFLAEKIYEILGVLQSRIAKRVNDLPSEIKADKAMKNAIVNPHDQVGVRNKMHFLKNSYVNF